MARTKTSPARRTKAGPAPERRPFLETRSGRVLLLIGILAVAAFLRFHRLSTAPPGLHCDEAMNGNLAVQVLETGQPQVYYPENNGTEGLFVNALILPVYLLGHTAFALRIVSAVFGFLTVWGLYFLGKELLSTTVGLLAAFFAATSFWHIDLSRIAVRGPAAPCLLVWSLALFLAAMRRLRGNRPYLATMLAAGALYGLGFHTYISYRVTPILVAGLFLYYYRRAAVEDWRPRFWRATAVFAASAFVVILPLLVYFIRVPAELSHRTGQVSVLNSPHPALELANNVWKTAAMFFIHGDSNWRHNYDKRAELYWLVAIFFAAGIAGAVLELRKRWTNAANQIAPADKHLASAFLLAWLVLGAVPEVLSNEGVPHALRAILMVPPVCLLAAEGALICYALAGRIRRPVREVAAVAVLLFLAYEPYHTYFDLWAARTEVGDAFQLSMAQISSLLNDAPVAMPKLVGFAAADPPAANGIAMDLQPVAFLTHSYTEKERQETNFRYLTLSEIQAAVGSKATGSELCDQTAKVHWQGKMVCWGLENPSTNADNH